MPPCWSSRGSCRAEGTRARADRACARPSGSSASARSAQSRSRLARLRSPAAIVAYGLRDEELELALALGADAVVNVATADARPRRRVIAGGLDVVVETARSGRGGGARRPGSRARAAGIVAARDRGPRPRADAARRDRIALRDLSVLGSVGYTTAAWARMVGPAPRPARRPRLRSSPTGSRSSSSRTRSR